MIILSEVSQMEKDRHQISLKCGTEDMTQMNIYMAKKLIHGHREQTYGFQGRQRALGEEWSKRLGLRAIN